MATPELFLTWVRSELPWLYDKNTNYADTSNMYQLLTQVKNYYSACQANEAKAYNTVYHLNNIKNDQVTRFNAKYTEDFDTNTSYEAYDQLTKNGILSDPLYSYKLLEEKLSDLLLPIGG